jgi:hypothetical protein
MSTKEGFLLCCIAEKYTKKQLTPFMEFHRFSSGYPQLPSNEDIKQLEAAFNIHVNGKDNYVDFVWIENEEIDMSIDVDYEYEKQVGYDHLST